MLVLVPIFIAYLIGGIPFGLLIPRLVGVADIRRQGSGNIGATNVWRVLGFKAAIWVYLGDIAKGFVAVMIARYFLTQYPSDGLTGDTLLVLCALAAVIGHVFPVYLRFRGGKGVNTALGGVIALLPLEAVISFIVFAVVVAISRYVSLGSMLGALALLVTIVIEKYVMDKPLAVIYVIMAAVVVVLIILTHRQNIVRLLTGTENKFTRSVKSNKAGSSA